ncbi:CLUMA_CG010633, isoform A [Clunio marinus]|uniref:CLUMA_CG010633, isoform A n=1 Tax=Clunio marinus TaxID=568069 RepID=A0A1J1IAC4_9DIPT|nr:CLUMA_CG010633, isoform A [Clunio marinus]
MITGGDLAPRPSYRYGPHPPPPDYSRPMHQMHYPPTYPPSPYGYYGQPPPPPHQEICYSPYYPPKYYPPNAPYARRFMTPNYYQPPPLDYRPPPQAVPQNAPSQIAPAAPTPQHIDHYSSSPYYAGYSPNNGGQCYSQTQPRTMQPPYLDAAQYHSSSCPCPMQSCPKNAHTGTGPTNKAKGPVSANTTIAESNPKTISTFNIASCKIENITSPNVVIKPENNDKMEASPSNSHELFSQHLNLKMLESPELTPSPARGSIGLQIPPTVQHEAVQPTEHSSDINSFSQRKHPRVGKSMERERQHQQHITMGGTMTYQTTLENSDNVALELTQFKKEFTVKKEGDVKKEKDCDMIDRGYRSINPIDNVKLERPEAEHDSLSTQMAPKQTTNNFVTDTITVNLINESGDECVDYSMKRKLDETSNDDVIELSDNSTVDPPSLTLKRRKLLEKPVSTPKKSPPNSYKSLIKQANPSTTTYQSSTSKSKLLTSNINRLSNKSNIKRRTILKSKNVRLLAKAKKRSPKKNVTEDESDKVESVNGDDNAENDSVIDVNKFNNEDISETTEKSDEIAEETSTENDNHEDKSMDGSSEYSGKSNIDLTIDRVAKGYFSESDIFTCLSKQRKTKSQKKFDAKLIKSGINDKKNAKKAKTDVTDVPVKDKTKKKSKVNKEADMQQEAAGDNELRKARKLKKLKVKEIDDGGKNKSKKKPKDGEKEPLSLDDILPSHSTPKRKQKTPKNVESKKEKKEKVVENLTVSALIESDEDDKTVVTVETRDEETSTTLLSSAQTINTTKSQLDETDVANNNNECFEDNNRHKQQESLTLYKTPGYGWTMNKTGKRGKKTKFSNRKKHKFTLLNDIVIPKSTSIPRWSNGWVWGGDPYQALVFLNSDDPPVPRTCYDSMRHEECGDVIRPRDCVLLRAGGKRNELPYVAKVAQLWENPEDGEMMMSLFWYYRPEHTEQGRQENDASDEVFASRHKDHNSVACIEDKCHVLTYNEYCRYRKSLRQLEENLDEQVSFVPKLHFPERRTVPPQTSPELVMFCRRVYDFRGKRLVEDKKKK